MFSTTTMASSTRMPIEKMSANRLTRSMVMPQIQAVNTVMNSTTGMTSMTTIAGRRARKATSTRMKTKKVATTSLKISSLTLSLAVSP